MKHVELSTAAGPAAPGADVVVMAPWPALTTMAEPDNEIHRQAGARAAATGNRRVDQEAQ
jgi:hypothetical protein